MKCPKCSAAMEAVDAGGQTVDRCTGCGGLWFDNLEREHLMAVKDAVAKVDTGDAAKGHEMNDKRAMCPVDGVRMLALVVHGQPHIKYESCPICHATFFDAGEIKDFADLTLGERVKRFFDNLGRKY